LLTRLSGFESSNKKRKCLSLNSQRGQILIEYILLLLIGITIALILSKKLTGYSDEPDDRGVVIKRWIRIWDSIGKDTPDN
jgi:hypothetical protein